MVSGSARATVSPPCPAPRPRTGAGTCGAPPAPPGPSVHVPRRAHTCTHTPRACAPSVRHTRPAADGLARVHTHHAAQSIAPPPPSRAHWRDGSGWFVLWLRKWLAVVGGWRLAVGGWRLAVGGPWGRPPRAALNKTKLLGHPCLVMHYTPPSLTRTQHSPRQCPPPDRPKDRPPPTAPKTTAQRRRPHRAAPQPPRRGRPAHKSGPQREQRPAAPTGAVARGAAVACDRRPPPPYPPPLAFGRAARPLRWGLAVDLSALVGQCAPGAGAVLERPGGLEGGWGTGRQQRWTGGGRAGGASPPPICIRCHWEVMLFMGTRHGF